MVNYYARRLLGLDIEYTIKLDPFLTPIVVIPVMFAFGYILQKVLINRVSSDRN